MATGGRLQATITNSSLFESLVRWAQRRWRSTGSKAPNAQASRGGQPDRGREGGQRARGPEHDDAKYSGGRGCGTSRRPCQPTGGHVTQRRPARRPPHPLILAHARFSHPRACQPGTGRPSAQAERRKPLAPDVRSSYDRRRPGRPSRPTVQCPPPTRKMSPLAGRLPEGEER